MSTITVTDKTFSGVIMNEKPTLVLFGASWSGHSQLMLQIMDSIAEQYPDEVQVCIAQADENADTIAKFGIRQVPTLALFKSGRLEGVRIGRQSREDTSAFVRETLQ